MADVARTDGSSRRDQRADREAQARGARSQACGGRGSGAVDPARHCRIRPQRGRPRLLITFWGSAMCYSAQIEANYRKYLRLFGAGMSIREYVDLFWRRTID